MSFYEEKCYVIVCDCCGDAYESGDSIVHFDSPESAETYVIEHNGWITTADARHHCAPCWATYACATFGHLYSAWYPCGCRGATPGHSATGCGLFRHCERQGCTHEEEATLANLPTIDEPRRSR